MCAYAGAYADGVEGALGAYVDDVHLAAVVVVHGLGHRALHDGVAAFGGAYGEFPHSGAQRSGSRQHGGSHHAV